MKLILTTLFTLATLFIYPQDQFFQEEYKAKETPKMSDGFWYASGGIVLLLPKIATGYRYQKEKFGFDVSFTYAVLSYGLQLNPLFFPHPNPRGQFYLGATSRGTYNC